MGSEIVSHVGQLDFGASAILGWPDADAISPIARVSV